MADDREALGRLVRETWVAWAREQYRPKPSWLAGWDELDGGQREADMRIGSAVAAQAVAAERERIRQLAIRTRAVCTGDEGTSFYFAALIETGGGEEAPGG